MNKGMQSTTAKTAEKKEPCQDWYFTFGVGQGNRMFHVCINGTQAGARKRMVDFFGTIWSMQYTESKFMEAWELSGSTLHPICNIPGECENADY